MGFPDNLVDCRKEVCEISDDERLIGVNLNHHVDPFVEGFVGITWRKMKVPKTSEQIRIEQHIDIHDQEMKDEVELKP